MGDHEKFCLQWNDFESNISKAFRHLREDKDFFDVTLVCDDDQIQAHKVILSACSEFFQRILRRNKHEHPLLYLKDVKHSDLVSVLNFMYHGRVSVAQDELNSFLSVAEDLKVKGLTQSNSDSQNKSSLKTEAVTNSSSTYPASKPFQYKHSITASSKREVNSRYQPVDDDDEIQEVLPIKSEPAPNPPIAAKKYITAIPHSYPANNLIDSMSTAVVSDLNNIEYGDVEDYTDYGYNGAEPDGNKELDDMIEQHIFHNPNIDPTKPWQCNQCKKTFKGKGHVKDHIEGTHIVGLSFTCPYCDLGISSRHRLRTHISLKHNIEHKEKQIKISQLQPSYQAV